MLKMKKTGSREEVMAGMAMQTAGGLKRKDLFMDPKDGKIKSVRKSKMAKAQGGAFGTFAQKPRKSAVRGGAAQKAQFRQAMNKFLNRELMARGIPANLQGGAIVANIQGAGKVKDFIKKVFSGTKKVVGSVADALTSDQLNKLANIIADALVATGIPKAGLAGLTIKQMVPTIQNVLRPFRSENIGAGVVLPGGQICGNGVVLPGFVL